MDKIIFYLSVICLLFPAESFLPEEIQEELFEMRMKKLTIQDIETYYDNYFTSDNFLNKKFTDSIKYNKTIIGEILQNYSFPRNYNFLEENNISANVKDQGNCGSSWSFSATSALAYRYKYLHNISVDLSAQDGLSCLTRSCQNGFNILDSQINLLKNGSVTEECFPYSSEEGGIPDECLDNFGECKNKNIEFIKYKAKNLYTSFTSLENYAEENYYDFFKWKKS